MQTTKELTGTFLLTGSDIKNALKAGHIIFDGTFYDFPYDTYKDLKPGKVKLVLREKKVGMNGFNPSVQ